MLKRALLALLAVPAIAGLTLVAVRLTPGPQRDGTTLLPSGWRIHPAGRQVDVGTLPLNVVTLSDGSVLVTNNGYGENGLMRIDPLAGSVVWRLPLKAAWLGLARSGRDWRDTRWASGDAATLARRGAVAVGHRPYTVVADVAHLYVSDWGDSTVSVVDLSATPPTRRSMFVGPHPSALALRGGELFVALAGANGIVRVDLARGAVVEQLSVALDPHAPTGSDPNALALSPDGKTLYVAMAGNNAVAVVRLETTRMRVAGLVPVGWYPTAVAVSPDGRALYVANGKGAGSGANPDRKDIGN